MKHKDIEVHKKILNHFGEIRQARKAAEEMNELSSKLLAWADSKENQDDYYAHERMIEKFDEARDELADTLNILEQMKIIFSDVSQWRENKINRTFNNYEI